MDNRRRIELLDAWRTLAIVLMIGYHFLYDLGVFGVVTWRVVFSKPAAATQLFICCSFILVSGISSRLSRSNIKRGALTFGCAMLVSAGAYFGGLPIWFGILHFLGVSMLLYGAAGKVLERIPRYIAPLLYAALFIITKLWADASNPVGVSFLFPLGFWGEGFSSSDYFPLLPWMFLFLLGTWLGGEITRHRDAKLLTLNVPRWITWAGRHSLIIYLVHQPVLYGICILLF